MLDEVKVNGGSTMPLGREDVGELFQLPKVNEDVKQERYLGTAITMITPAIARDSPHMKDGGLNIYNHCLRHTGHFVKRGRIVPLLTNTHTPIPVEEVNTENSAYFEIPAGGDMTFRGDGPLATEGGYVGYPAYPGQQITHILEGSVIGGIQRLAGEISTLKGHKYTLKDMGGFLSDPDLWKIQLALFPQYPEVPTLLSEFTRQVKVAFDSNTGDIRNVAQDWLAICQQGKSWLIRHIEQVHQRMGQAAAQGYLFPYDDVDLVLLPQLGIDRQDEHYKRTAQQAAASAQAAVDPASLVALLRESSKENREMFMTGLGEIMKEWKADSGKPDQGASTVTLTAEEVQTALVARYERDVFQVGAAEALGRMNAGEYGEGFMPPVVKEANTGAILNVGHFDLSGPCPANVHHKTWEKMQRDAQPEQASE